jgi:hypothetical protein
VTTAKLTAINAMGITLQDQWGRTAVQIAKKRRGVEEEEAAEEAFGLEVWEAIVTKAAMDTMMIAINWPV